MASGFYEHNLICVHPTVTYFRCEVPGCHDLVRLEIIHMSKILKHNASAFNKFNNDTVNIAEAEARTNFKLVINVTDGAPSQY